MKSIDRTETISTTVFTVEYGDEPEEYEVTIHYESSLPTELPVALLLDRYPVGDLAAELEEGERNAVVSRYEALTDLVIDETMTEYSAETDTERTSWVQWLTDNEYEEFARVLSAAANEAREAYLIVSTHELPEEVIWAEIDAYVEEEWSRRQRARENIVRFGRSY